MRYGRQAPGQAKLLETQPPPELTGRPTLRSEFSLRAWEDQLIGFLMDEGTATLSEYSRYYRLRTNEFRVLRGLLREVFAFDRLHPTVLEVGCGFGFKSMLLAQFAERVIGIDIPDPYVSHTMAGYSNSVTVARALVNEGFQRTDILFESAWPREIPLADKSVDLIYSEYVLEHVEDLVPVMNEFRRVLRTGGLMVHVVPNVLDATVEMARSNLRPPWRTLIRSAVRRLINRSSGGPGLTALGTVIPPPHSEFLHHFADQLSVYSLDSYLGPMLEAGFEVERIDTTRGINNVLVLSALDRDAVGG